MTAPNKEELSKRNENIILSGLRHVLNSEEGRAWYFDLLGKCGVFRSEFIETNIMFFEAGKKNLGLMLMGEAEQIDPDLFLKMWVEATNRKKENDNAPGTSNNTSTSSDYEHKFASVDTSNLV